MHAQQVSCAWQIVENSLGQVAPEAHVLAVTDIAQYVAYAWYVTGCQAYGEVVVWQHVL
jgi:hypothetical protein